VNNYDDPNGIGQEFWKNGQNISGQYISGKLDGVAKVEEPDRSIYWGQFKDGINDGYTTYQSKSTGQVCIGQFKDKKLNGYGINKQVADGVTYHGQYKDDKRDGYGRYSQPSRYEYDGQWKDGLKDGEGTFKCIRTNKVVRAKWNKGKQVY
jgi:hypothetical protein